MARLFIRKLPTLAGLGLLVGITTSFGGKSSLNMDAVIAAIRVRGHTMSYYRAPEHASPPVNMLDPYDSFQKDEDGDLIITASGSEISSDFTGSEYRRYVLFTKKGRAISVAQETPSRRLRHKSNCHGLTFLHGDYWLPSTGVTLILKDNGWVRVDKSDVRRGDVAVYHNLIGKIVHTARVIGRDDRGRILVTSKDGFEMTRQSVRAELVVP